jgi:hypothetical protein
VEAGFATKPRSIFQVFEHDSAADRSLSGIVLERRVAKERGAL